MERDPGGFYIEQGYNSDFESKPKEKKHNSKKKKKRAEDYTDPHYAPERIKKLKNSIEITGFCKMKTSRGGECGRKLNEKQTFYCEDHHPLNVEYSEYFEDFIQWYNLDSKVNFYVLNEEIKKSLYRYFIKMCRNMAYIIMDNIQFFRIKCDKRDRERIVSFPQLKDYNGKFTMGKYYFDTTAMDLLKRWNVYIKYRRLTKLNECKYE